MSDHNFKKLSMQRWLVATLELDRESAREALGKPDLIETDRFAGRRGLEDHWFFLDDAEQKLQLVYSCLLYTSPSPRDQRGSRMPSSA